MAYDVDGRHRRFGLSPKTLILAALLLVLLAGAGYGWARYSAIKKENEKLKDPQQAAQAEAEQLKTKVGALIELPANENPTIATVVDASKLKSQAFFANAQNGDRVLMFPEAKKAILYRPSTNKIIEVAPINIGNNESTTTNQTQTNNP